MENPPYPFVPLHLKTRGECSIEIGKAGIGINAGHDLNLKNIKYFKENIENLLEVSIGHALITESLYFGLEKTIKKYLEFLS